MVDVKQLKEYNDVIILLASLDSRQLMRPIIKLLGLIFK